MRNMRIFIVEDNPSDVLLVREALESCGVRFSLERYSNGEDAAKAIAAMEEVPDLFLLDLNVPRVDGFELLRLIRSGPAMAEAAVAILTSSAAVEDRIRSEQYGADSYIIKPQGYHEFVAEVGARLHALLHRKRSGNCRWRTRAEPMRGVRAPHLVYNASALGRGGHYAHDAKSFFTSGGRKRGSSIGQFGNHHPKDSG